MNYPIKILLYFEFVEFTRNERKKEVLQFAMRVMKYHPFYTEPIYWPTSSSQDDVDPNSVS